MSTHHQGTILQHSLSTPGNFSQSDFFANVMRDIMRLLYLQGVDKDIANIKKCNSSDSDTELTECILNSCSLEYCGKSLDIYEYVEEKIKHLSLNEMFAILSHANLSELEYMRKDIMQLVSSSAFTQIRDSLMTNNIK